jgi:hypothetical protein
MPKKNGFTKLPHGFHKRIGDLSGVELKVWLCHRCMEGKDGTSYPSLETLAEYTGCCTDKICRARASLRKRGWLKETGTMPSANGRFSVPVMTTVVPPLYEKDKGDHCTKDTTDGCTKDTSTVVQNTATVKSTTEVVPPICTPEVVPTQAAPVEVLPASLPEPLVEGIPPSGLDKGIEEIDNILNEGATVWSLEAVIVSDIYHLFDIHASPDELRFISGTVREDYDLWQIVLKMAGSKSWSKLITKPENLVFRMGINPKTGKSAFMAKCRAALEGRQRHRQQQAVEAKEAGARRFVVDDCAPRPKFHGKRIA